VSTSNAIKAGAAPRWRTITIKQAVAVTGLMMAGFLIGHLAGNLILLKSDPKAFNDYAKFLASLGAGLWIARIILIAALIIHLAGIAYLVMENRAARSTRYAVHNWSGKPTMAVRSMLLTGSLVLAFLALHLWHFTFTEHHGPAATINGQDLGLFGLVYNSFHLGWTYTIIYLVAMVLLGLHLDHGIQSLFKTLGFNHPDYTPKIRIFSRLFAVAIAGGFAIIPLYIKLFHPMEAAL